MWITAIVACLLQLLRTRTPPYWQDMRKVPTSHHAVSNGIIQPVLTLA